MLVDEAVVVIEQGDQDWMCWNRRHTKIFDLDSHAFIQTHLVERDVRLVWDELAIALFGDAQAVDGKARLSCHAIVDVFAAVGGQGVGLFGQILDWLACIERSMHEASLMFEYVRTSGADL